jgi:hypothetical protein
MKPDRPRVSLAAALFAAMGCAVAVDSTAADSTTVGSLRAGMARVDVTPAVADLPAPFQTVHDPIFVRALVLDDGTSREAIVIGDLPTIAPREFDELRQRIAAQVRAPAQNVLLAVTHSHNAVRIDHVAVGIALPGSPKIADLTMSATMDAVKQAVAGLQPARIGYATGTTPVAGRRVAASAAPITDDLEAVDRTIGVLKVESAAGQPLAFVFNAPVEPVVDQVLPAEISSDVSGAAERYIEQRFGDKVVALFTVGSAVGTVYGGRPAEGLPPPDVHAVISAMGTILGEDVLATSTRVRTTSTVKISAAAKVLECPGKSTYPLNLPRACSDAPGSKLPPCVFKDTDTGPVVLQMGVLKIGDLSIVESDADITPAVWQRLKHVAPADTALVSLLYGPMHYVIEDSVYPTNSYQATATMAKMGCAADGFVNGALDMIRQMH